MAQEAQAQGQYNILEEILDKGRMVQSSDDRGRATDLIKTFVNEVISDEERVSPDVISSIERRIAELDSLLSAQMSAILHAPEFQKLEGSWRDCTIWCTNPRRVRL